MSKSEKPAKEKPARPKRMGCAALGVLIFFGGWYTLVAIWAIWNQYQIGLWESFFAFSLFVDGLFFALFIVLPWLGNEQTTEDNKIQRRRMMIAMLIATILTGIARFVDPGFHP